VLSFKPSQILKQALNRRAEAAAAAAAAAATAAPNGQSHLAVTEREGT
jgi:hypothetical protein